ncbi:MAG: response regulator [Methylocella sp.]
MNAGVAINAQPPVSPAALMAWLLGDSVILWVALLCLAAALGFICARMASRGALSTLIDEREALRDEVWELKEAAASAERAETAEAKKPGYEILLAEDNDINALLTTRHLERLGGRVTRAADGLTAVARAERALSPLGAKFDIIFLDIRMPGIDGMEAARRIRAAETATGAVPVRLIALTANAFDEHRRAAEAVGFDDFLTKPVDFERIRRALQFDLQAEPEHNHEKRQGLRAKIMP